MITQGSRGVSVGLSSEEILTVPVRPAKVVDTTGAGDTLNGAFCYRIAMGDSVEDALRYANTAASLSTEKFSAQGGMPTAEEVEKALKSIIQALSCRHNFRVRYNQTLCSQSISDSVIHVSQRHQGLSRSDIVIQIRQSQSMTLKACPARQCKEFC